ncbi:hypothetical protein QLX08_011610 [Tetragonisca angustula]|uniref:Uncharacterized protein n=1 Tax=Tetragonisca angustula TaxID=166442 RepID=A0AAW0Z972_9HYME
MVEDVETLNDHRYIVMDVIPQRNGTDDLPRRDARDRGSVKTPKRWAVSRMDPNLLVVAIAELWAEVPDEPTEDVELEATRF